MHSDEKKGLMTMPMAPSMSNVTSEPLRGAWSPVFFIRKLLKPAMGTNNKLPLTKSVVANTHCVGFFITRSPPSGSGEFCANHCNAAMATALLASSLK